MSRNPTYRIISLFSGSRGNCTLLRVGDTRILVDAGMSCRAIERALAAVGESLSEINAVFITHEHSDHTKALPVLLKRHPVPVHLAEPTARELARAGFPTDCFAVHSPCFSVRVAAGKEAPVITVQSFPIPHDSRCCIGYRFCAEGEGYSRCAAIATDMGCVTEDIRTALSGAHEVILESNHDENMLMMGPYPYELKRRILSESGHLSNGCAAEFLCELTCTGARHLLLAHLSPENNTPELAYLTARTALCRRGLVQDEDYTLAVAHRDTPVILFEEGDAV
ncbi:MAG: MBL fold metallo-hydrolase [Clostridia bacterium]|nr:MBL fold metallo-hydrolase [Clostridia bacterium]